MPKTTGNAPTNGDRVLLRMPGNVLDGAKAKVKRRGSTGWTLELLEARVEAYPVGTTVNAGAAGYVGRGTTNRKPTIRFLANDLILDHLFPWSGSRDYDSGSFGWYARP